MVMLPAPRTSEIGAGVLSSHLHWPSCSRDAQWRPAALVTPGQASVFHPWEPHPRAAGDGEQVWVAAVGPCAEAGLQAPSGRAPPRLQPRRARKRGWRWAGRKKGTFMELPGA